MSNWIYKICQKTLSNFDFNPTTVLFGKLIILTIVQKYFNAMATKISSLKKSFTSSSFLLWYYNNRTLSNIRCIVSGITARRFSYFSLFEFIIIKFADVSVASAINKSFSCTAKKSNETWSSGQRVWLGKECYEFDAY